MAEKNRDQISDIQSQKKMLRRDILAKRGILSDRERENAERLLTAQIVLHPWFVTAEKLLGFASYGSEICTDGILEEALRQGKELYLPRVEGEEMHFYRVRDMAALQPGYKGIREPKEIGEAFVYAGTETEQVLLLLPGVAFDLSGNRMGYGKGFYDRFLAGHSRLARTIGVGFACQLVQCVPHAERDICVGEVICV